MKKKQKIKTTIKAKSLNRKVKKVFERKIRPKAVKTIEEIKTEGGVQRPEIATEYPYLYVYGITDKPVDLELKGLKDQPIKSINFQNITVLVSSYPNLYHMLKEDEAMQHADILKKIAEKTTLIPMAFGTVFKDIKILETVLSKAHQTIISTLKLIEDKIELGIKVIKDSTDDPLYGVSLDVIDTLNKISFKSIKGDNFSSRLLLNQSFLVEKDKFSKFSDEVAKLENKYKDLKFIYTGPWPPYSFVNIRIGGG